MNLYYDQDIDYLEVYFQKEENYGEPLDDQVLEFRSEKSDQIIGYGFENASQTVFESEFLSVNAKLAAMLRILRSYLGLTQLQMAHRIGALTSRHYQRLEAGEDTTLEMLEKISIAFPDYDFSKILRRKKPA